MGQVEHAIEVNVPVRTAYDQWTQFESFPHFMEGVESVQQMGDQRLHWRAKIAGKVEEWDAVINEQEPDQVIAWQSTSGAPNGGRVTFQPAGQESTRVSLRMEYEPQGFAENVGDALGFVSRRVEGDLHRFKEFIEARGQETGAWRGQVQSGQPEGSKQGTSPAASAFAAYSTSGGQAYAASSASGSNAGSSAVATNDSGAAAAEMASGAAAGSGGNMSGSFAESSRSASPNFAGAASASDMGSGSNFAGAGASSSGGGLGVDTSGGESEGAGGMARSTGGAENLDREHRDNTAWAGGSLGAVTGAGVGGSSGETGNPELAGGMQGDTSGTGYRDATTTAGAESAGSTPSASSGPGGSTGPDTAGGVFSPASGRSRAGMNEDVEGGAADK